MRCEHSAGEAVSIFEEKCDEAVRFIIDYVGGIRRENDMFEAVNYRSLTGNNKGIYIFAVSEDLKLSTSELERFNRPKKIKRGKHKGRDASMPRLTSQILRQGDLFYIGSKVSGSLQARISQHYDAELSSVSALRLNLPQREFVGRVLTVYTFLLKNDLGASPITEYCIIKTVEGKLHREKGALSGSGRLN
ncbi:MAG: hypothetical protein IJR63_08385 [Synergistaceae bacterium]|nr:hypothetical protein [Synergistaceae bacterium]